MIEVGNNVQAIFGTQADALKNSMQTALAANPMAPPADLPAPPPAAPVVEEVEPAEPVATTAPEPVVSPVQGSVIALSEVPDPVFSGGAMGEGFAVMSADGTFRAPVAGKLSWWRRRSTPSQSRPSRVARRHRHRHRPTEGGGLHPAFNQGDTVEAGDPVVRVDLATVTPLVPSMATPVLVANGRTFDVSALDASATGGEPVVTVTPK